MNLVPCNALHQTLQICTSLRPILGFPAAGWARNPEERFTFLLLLHVILLHVGRSRLPHMDGKVLGKQKVQVN